MSRETLEWLNTNTLQGYTDKRGNAWHWREGSDNHYPGAIPVEEVKRRLFSWEPVAGPVETTIKVDGKQRKFIDTERQVIVRPDTGGVLGVFKQDYQIHGYNQWLIDYVANLLDAQLHIGSAGLLQGGAVAWVQIELEDTINHPSGVEFRSHLTAATSLNGTLKTSYVSGNNVVVCDNTLSAALADKAAKVLKIKHTKKSLPKIAQVRDALEIILATADDFSETLTALTTRKCSDKRYENIINVLTPLPDEQGRSLTLAENKHDVLWQLWNNDPRVSPWKGTEWGVVQAVNTYQQHESILRGQLNRVERNTLDLLKGKVDETDLATLDLLAAVPA